jgi:ABC-2 type transport system ATP-binding protein
VIAAGQIVAEGPPATIGHRDLGVARIRFRLPDGAVLPDGMRLPRQSPATSVNGFTEIASDDLVADLHRLTSWALDGGITLDGLEVTRPSLEDVYLRLTGDPEGISG